MPENDVWAGLGAIASTIMAALSWLLNIGFLQLLFSFLTGSLATYLVQARLQDRAEKRQVARQNFALMRDVIYGPLFRQINQIDESLKSFEKPQFAEIGEIMGMHLYFAVSEELRQLINNFVERVRRYIPIEEASEGAAEQISQETIHKYLERRHLNADLTIHYRLFVGSKMVKIVDLPRALLQDKTPNEILKEQAEGLKASSTDVTVGGYSYDSVEEVHGACEIALQKMRTNPMFQERESERKYLIKEAGKIVQQIKPFIIL